MLKVGKNMVKKASDKVCLENIEKINELFSKGIDDASRFHVVYGCGIDVGMMDFIATKEKNCAYTSYAIGFDEIANEIVVLLINRDLSSYDNPIYVQKNEVKKTKISMLSKEVLIYADKFPEKYITFTVPEELNEDVEENFICVKQEEEAKRFLAFFKDYFS